MMSTRLICSSLKVSTMSESTWSPMTIARPGEPVNGHQLRTSLRPLRGGCGGPEQEAGDPVRADDGAPGVGDCPTAVGSEHHGWVEGVEQLAQVAAAGRVKKAHHCRAVLVAVHRDAWCGGSRADRKLADRCRGAADGVGDFGEGQSEQTAARGGPRRHAVRPRAVYGSPCQRTLLPRSGGW